MGNFIQWSDTQVWKAPAYRDPSHHNPLITEPFLAYVGTKRFKRFADWLYQYDRTRDNFRYNYRFGKFEPKNLADEALKSVRSKSIYRATNDDAILMLKNLQDKLIRQEETLYADLGCRNFAEFKQLWDKGETSDNETINKKNYWLNYHLSLLTGETQRIATTKGWTDIEQILALAAIELDKIDSKGMEGEQGKGKLELKRRLERADILEFVEEPVIYKRYNKEHNVFIPAPQYRKMSDNDFITILKNYFAEEAAKATSKDLKRSLENNFDAQMAQALSRVQKNLENKARELKTTSLDAAYVNISFKAKKPTKRQIQTVSREVRDFYRKARVMDNFGNNPEKWKEDNIDTTLESYIDQKMEEMVGAYLKTHNPFGINPSDALYVAEVLGFFGELASFGKSYFHLESLKSDSLNIETFGVGGFKSVEKKQMLASDTIIRVNNRNYGIQVKNPFNLNDGYKEVYDNKFNFTSPNFITALKQFFNFDENQFEAFEMYNLNINNTTNPSYFIQQMNKFLMLHADLFARLDEQTIRQDFELTQSKQLKKLVGSSVNNVFFILKGEIFPSSYILEGLIKQYNYLRTDWRNYQRATSKNNKVLIVNYKNDINGGQPNTIPEEDEGKPFIEVGENYINRDIDKLLRDVKFNVHVKLNIPSISTLMDFYKDYYERRLL